MVNGRCVQAIKNPQKGKGMKAIAATLALVLGGCASGPVIIGGSAAPCSSLLPAPWTEPVPPPAFPQDAASVRDWQVYGVQATGGLATANGRTQDVIAVIRSCEARDAAAIRSLRPWWARLRPG